MSRTLYIPAVKPNSQLFSYFHPNLAFLSRFGNMKSGFFLLFLLALVFVKSDGQNVVRKIIIKRAPSSGRAGTSEPKMMEVETITTSTTNSKDDAQIQKLVDARHRMMDLAEPGLALDEKTDNMFEGKFDTHTLEDFGNLEKDAGHLLDNAFASTSSLMTDEFMGGDKLFEEFFPGALHHQPKGGAGSLLSSIMSGVQELFAHSSGLRNGRHQSRRVWNSKDHAHKSPKQCCCRDIHTFCSHIHTDGSPVGFYNVMKCLADRSRAHHDVHPLCVIRLEQTVAGNCAAEIDRFCSAVRPGNNALHKCLVKHQNDGATSAKCQGYLDLVDLSDEKVKHRGYHQPAVEMAFKRVNATQIVPAKTTKHTVTVLKMNSKMAAPTALSAVARGGVDAPSKHAVSFVVRPVYLIVGIAGISVLVVAIAFAVKRKRQQRRAENMEKLIKSATYDGL